MPPSSLLNKSLSLFHSLRLIFGFFFFSSHTHPHTILSIGKHQPIQPVAYSPLSSVGRSITWFDGSYYRPAFPGQEAGIFIVADKGSSKTLHPLEEEDNRTQVWFIIIFLPFQGNVKYGLPPPLSCGERHSIVIASFEVWCAFVWNGN